MSGFFSPKGEEGAELQGKGGAHGADGQLAGTTSVPQPPSSASAPALAPEPAPPSAAAHASPGELDHSPRSYEDGECAVCLAPFQEGDEVRDLPCGHSFHTACIDEWLIAKGRPPATGEQLVRGLASCPLCKTVPVDVPPPTLPDGSPASALVSSPPNSPPSAAQPPTRRSLRERRSIQWGGSPARSPASSPARHLTPSERRGMLSSARRGLMSSRVASSTGALVEEQEATASV